MVKLQLRVKSILSDRTAYKKYGVMYEPDGLYLIMDVPDELVIDPPIDEFDDVVKVSEEGLRFIVGKLADLVDGIEDEYIARIKKG